MLRKALIIGYWASHLGFATAFVSSATVREESGRLGPAVSVYGAYTGAANGYAFFAPVVPDARRVRVRVLCKGRWVPVSPPLEGVESRTRLMTITSLLMRPETEDAAAASWAAFALGRVSCGETALLEVERYAIPTIAAYRSGARPEWRLASIHAFTEGHHRQSTGHGDDHRQRR